MTGFARRALRSLQAARYDTVTRRVEGPEDALRLAYWAEKAPLRIEMPVSLLRTQGGFALGPDHPFVHGLIGGADALRRFYDGFAPATLGALYGIDSELPHWRLPWRLVEKPAPPPGEKGLTARHGVAFYGPCSDRKVALEARRLAKVSGSIAAAGYAPERHGDIEGHLITDGTRTVFFVMGGKHRAAALAHSGVSHIPVAFREGRMRVVDGRAVADWPMVASGELTPDAALAIADVYLRGRGVSDVLPGEGGEIGE